MGELNFQTGRKTYTVNGGAEISFEPANPEFAGKIVKAFQKCTEIAQNVRTGQDMQVDELLTLSESVNIAVRAEIDAAFDVPVCDKVFGSVNAISIAGGLPIWANFLMAVIDEIDHNMPEEEKKASLAVQKYVAKYNKKRGKKAKK